MAASPFQDTSSLGDGSRNLAVDPSANPLQPAYHPYPSFPYSTYNGTLNGSSLQGQYGGMQPIHGRAHVNEQVPPHMSLDDAPSVLYPYLSNYDNNASTGGEFSGVRAALPDTALSTIDGVSNNMPLDTSASLSQVLAMSGNKRDYSTVDKWTLCYDALERYGQEHGTCNVPYKATYMLLDNTSVRLGKQ